MTGEDTVICIAGVFGMVLLHTPTHKTKLIGPIATNIWNAEL